MVEGVLRAAARDSLRAIGDAEVSTNDISHKPKDWRRLRTF